MRIYIPAGGGKAQHIRYLRDVPEVDRVIISEIDSWTYGNFVADASYILPRFDDADFFSALERMFRLDPFDVLLPIHDMALKLFSDRRDDLESFPFRMAMNPQATVDVVADKLATYRFFEDQGIPCKRLYGAGDFLSLPEYAFPYFVKPRYIRLRGSGREMYGRVVDPLDLEHLARRIQGREEDYVVQEFLSGQEINIDFFCDGKGEVRSIVPLKRLGMGTSRGITRGEIIDDDRFDEPIRRMASALRFWGANNAQAYLDADNEVWFTEINGRFSGSSVLVKEAGVNFFAATVRLLRGEPLGLQERAKPLKMCCWDHPVFFTESPAMRP